MLKVTSLPDGRPGGDQVMLLMSRSGMWGMTLMEFWLLSSSFSVTCLS